MWIRSLTPGSLSEEITECMIADHYIHILAVCRIRFEVLFVVDDHFLDLAVFDHPACDQVFDLLILNIDKAIRFQLPGDFLIVATFGVFGRHGRTDLPQSTMAT